MLRKAFSFLLALLFCLPLLASCRGEEKKHVLTLADGGATDYRIVIPADSSRTVERTAEEFARYLKRITRAEFAIVTDSEKPSGREFILGDTCRDEGEAVDREALGEDGFLIRQSGDNILILSGGERGLLYGVYAFLEEYLGVRYWAADMEKIPHAETLVLDSFPDNRQVPFFEIRHNSNAGYDEKSMQWREKLRLNQELNETLEGWNFTDVGVHSLCPLMGWSRSQGYRKQPCLTSEENYQLMLKNALASVKRSPGAEILSISQNDAPLGQFGNCTCDACLAEIEAYGYSGYMLNFVNRMARDVSKEYPDMLFHTFAYYDTIEPPKGGVVPDDNVLVQFCNAGSCMMHSYTAEDPESTSLYPANTVKWLSYLKQWCAIHDHVTIWDYNTNFGSTQTSIPNLTRLWELFQTYRECGVYGIFIQGMSNTGEFDNLRAYLSAKLLWNPAMTYEEYRALISEYLTGYYGAGAEHILTYIDRYSELADGAHPSMYYDAYRILPAKTVTDAEGKTVYDSTVVDELRSYWEAALEAAQTVREKKNVRRSMLPVYHLEVSQRLSVRTKTGEDLTRVRELNELIYETMTEFGIVSYKEGFRLPDEPNLSNSILYWNTPDSEGIFDAQSLKAWQDAHPDTPEAEDGGVIDVTQGQDAAEQAAQQKK